MYGIYNSFTIVYVTDEPNYFYNINLRSQDLIRGYGLQLDSEPVMQNGNKIIGVDLLGEKIPNKITEFFLVRALI